MQSVCLSAIKLCTRRPSEAEAFKGEPQLTVIPIRQSAGPFFI